MDEIDNCISCINSFQKDFILIDFIRTAQYFILGYETGSIAYGTKTFCEGKHTGQQLFFKTQT